MAYCQGARCGTFSSPIIVSGNIPHSMFVVLTLAININIDGIEMRGESRESRRSATFSHYNCPINSVVIPGSRVQVSLSCAASLELTLPTLYKLFKSFNCFNNRKVCVRPELKCQPRTKIYIIDFHL